MDVMQRPKRIGMITPSSNTVVEPVTAAMTRSLFPKVTTHFTRIEVQSISLEPASMAHFDLEPMLHAARLLAHAGMDVIAWNGTSGAWRGVEEDARFCETITRETGTPATTATLAQIEAFHLLGVHAYALAVPYLPQVLQAIQATYQRAGFQCVSSRYLGISTNRDFAYVPGATIRDLVRGSDSARADAIAVICTNLPAAWLVEELEAELRKPVIDSTVVTVWHSLRLLGMETAIPGWGSLMREPLVGRTPTA
jgi:maleate isomerase